MKKLSLIIILLFFTLPLFAQTFQVSGIDASDDKTYNQFTKELGKTIKLTFYDNSVSMSFTSGSASMNLKKVNETSYAISNNSANNGNGLIQVSLTLTKTFGVISSIQFEKSYTDNRNSSKNGWAKITAKRF